MECISLGSTHDLACKAAGISASIFCGWIARGRKEGAGEFWEFSQGVEKAEGNAVERWLAIIEKAAQNGNWTAAAWKLERIYPERYGKKFEHYGNVSVDFTNVLHSMRRDLGSRTIRTEAEGSAPQNGNGSQHH